MTEEDFEDMFEIPKDVIFPDELNRYLKEQILGFIQENAMLRKNLNESDEKCLQMQKDIEDCKNKFKKDENPILPPFACSSQTINSKIVELSRNYRDKCAELEKYKTKCSKLLCQFEELRKEENKGDTKPNVGKPDNEILSEIKQLREKLNTTTNKMLEIKNVNIQIKNELRQANKMLQQEIGEDLNSLQANSTWKGRAQIICDLQEKNRKLKDKLRNITEQGVAPEPKNNEKIGSKISALEKENTELTSQNEGLKIKAESLKSRSCMLETERQELKLKIQMIKDQSANDFKLIANISKQLAEADHTKKNAIKEKDTEITKLNMEIKNLLSQIENYKILVDNLKAKNEDFKKGNVKNDGQEQSDIQDRDDVDKQRFEEEKVKLLELITLYKNRLVSERNEHEKCQQLFRLEKHRAIKLEAIVAKSELEVAVTNRSRYSTMSQSSRSAENNLRNQLELAEESMKAIQTRLELEQNERKQDFQEFSKIISSSKPKNNMDRL